MGLFFLKIKLLFALTQSNVSKNVFSASFDNMFKAQEYFSSSSLLNLFELQIELF
jgi:hypothetical protein